jgi:protein dithiol oxidoreductase (disulfide-forming)
MTTTPIQHLDQNSAPLLVQRGLTRRDLGALSMASALAGLGLPAATLAQGKPPEEGLDFVKLDKPAPTEAAKGKIEVVEFFWYNCPHCNSFEPRLKAWLATVPKDVHFRRQPVAFRPEFVPQQHLYFTLEALGLIDALHQKIFYAIHVDKLDLSQRAGILAWVGKQAVKGLDINKFTQTFDSFAVASKATRATQLQTSYKVTGVPSIGIAGRFYTDGALAQSMDRALQVTNYLLGTQRKKQA